MSVYDLWRSGDVPDRFGQIYSQCQRSMFAYALRLTGGDYDLAEDVTQEAFVRIARNLAALDGKPPAAVYVYALKAVRCAALDLLKKRRHFPVPDEEEENLPEPSTGPDPVLDDLCAREDVRRIADCIRRLPVKYREVFYLYFVDNLSLREVADELKLPADTVRRRFSRGKQLLVRELEKGGVRNDA